MAAIIQQPDILSFASNIKKFEISSDSEVNFTISIGEDVLLDESYLPDSAGRILIDVKEIVKNNLFLTIPTANIFQQNSIFKTFTATIDEIEVSFVAIRSGVENLNDTPTNFLTGNFLTWQPQVKKISPTQPEWLTYYSPIASVLRVKFYLADGTTSIVTIANQAAGTCFSYNMQLEYIMSLSAGQKYGYFDVYFENAAGERLTYIQRFVYSEVLDEDEYFLFENSLGGLDTVLMSGSSTFAPVLSFAEGDYEETVSQLEFVKTRLYKKSTGLKDKVEAAWLWDFFSAVKRYKLINGSFFSISLSESTIEDISTEDLKSFSFSYKISKDTGLLNLQRSSDPLSENLQITLPDGLFFLAPRLVEFPVANLVDNLLFPVQLPASETWQVTTWGALYSALYSQFLTSAIATIAHEHSNLLVLGALSDVGGQLYYKGQPLVAPVTASISIINNLTSTSTSAALSANMGKYLKELIDTKQASIPENTYAPFSHLSDTLKHINITERSNWNSAYSAIHSHANKSIIDTISQISINNWNAAYNYYINGGTGSLIVSLNQNYIPKWGSSAFANSQLYDNGTGIGIGTTSIGANKLNVAGTGYFSGNIESAASVLASSAVKIGNWEIRKNGDNDLQILLLGSLVAKLFASGSFYADSITVNKIILNGHNLNIV